MNNRKAMLLMLLTGSFFGAIVGTVTLAVADNLRNTSNVLGANQETIVIPYDGYLMLDSTPLNGQKKMRFGLYEQGNNTPLWIEEHDVAVTAGRFSVGLGTGTKTAGSRATMGDVVLSAEKLELAISVEGAQPGSFVNLSGRQVIEAVPYAAWSAHSNELKAHSLNLSNDGDITNADQIIGTNDLRISGDPTTTTTSGDLYIAANGDITVQENMGINGWTDVRGLFYTNDIVGGKSAFPLMFWGSRARKAANPAAPDFYIRNSDGSVRARSFFHAESRLTVDEDLRVDNLTGRPGSLGLKIWASSNRKTSNPSSPDVQIRHTDGALIANNNLYVSGELHGLGLVQSGTHYADRYNAVGDTEKNMGTTNKRFCFLTKVINSETDAAGSFAGCQIIERTGNYILQAHISSAASGADAICEARCITFR